MLALFIGVATTGLIAGAATAAAAPYRFFAQAGQPLSQQINQGGQYATSNNHFLPHKRLR